MEAIIAVVIILSAIALIYSPEKRDSSSELTDKLQRAVDEVSTNSSFRKLILDDDDSSRSAETQIRAFIVSKVKEPGVSYNVTICDLNSSCNNLPEMSGEVYVKERVVSATLEEFKPKLLRVYFFR